MKNIESIIREEGQKMTATPTPQAWRKLEQRLDEHQPKRTNVIVMRQWLAVAASLLVLVSSFFLWNQSGSTGYDYMPTFVEEIEDNASCEPYCMLIEMRKELPGFYTVPDKRGLKDHS